MKKVSRFFKSTYKLWFLVGIFIYLYYATKCTNNSEAELLLGGEFAIGTFKDFYYNPGRAGADRIFEYYFYVSGNYKSNGSTFRGKFPDKTDRRNIFKGDQFLVLHNDDGSRILFEFRIRDSTDFIKYVKQFEELRQSWTNGEEALRWFKGINQSGTNNK